MKTIIGIDNGTQSTKVIFYDFQSRKIVAKASAPHSLNTREDGSREQEAKWWIEAAAKAFSQIDSEIRKTAIGVGVSGQQHGFVPIDRDGNVLHPVKLWCDTSTQNQCNTINNRAGGFNQIIDTAGNPVLVGYTASKILWLKENHPDLYKKMDTILLPHDYLNFVLTGNRVMEYGDASGTALLDVKNRCWSTEVIKALDPDRDLLTCLPQLIEPTELAGYVTEEASSLFGIPKGIVVSSGGGDNMMAAIGTGVVTEGSMAMSLGTSGTLYGFSKTPVIDKEGSIAAFCSSNGGWLPLLCTMNCTVSTELVRGLLGTEVKDIDTLAKKSTPGASGLIFLPFFNGERTPNLPNGRGTLAGMTMDNVTPENILRASMEAAIFGMKYGMDKFINLGFKPREIILTGGGSNSLLWRQIAADILDVPIVVFDNPEAGALGAAIQCLWSLESQKKGHSDLGELTKEHCTNSVIAKYSPGDNVEKYRKVYREYLKYLNTLKPLFE